MKTSSSFRLGLLSVMLLAPAMLIALPGVLFSVFTIEAANGFVTTVLQESPILKLVIHPIVILGGLSLAFLINARNIIDLGIQRRYGHLVGTVELGGGILSWGIVSAAIFLVTVMSVYAVAEIIASFAR